MMNEFVLELQTYLDRQEYNGYCHIILGDVNINLFSDEKITDEYLNASNELNFISTINKNPDENEYIIERAFVEDQHDILKLMKETYYKEEPICSELGITGSNPEMDDWMKESLESGFVVVARSSKTRRIVACGINELSDASSPDHKAELARQTKTTELRNLMKFYEFIQRYPDAWETYKVDVIVESTYVFVNKDHRRKGLALKLVAESLNVAKKLGYRILRCDATNIYTSKLCEKLNMQLIGQFPFATFVDENNKPVIQPPPPQDAVRIYVKIL